MILCFHSSRGGVRKGRNMTSEYAKNLQEPVLTVSESRAGYRGDSEDFLYEIRECVGILRKSNNGWTRELNVISWNGSAPKFDIREWDPQHEKMTKGITFTKAEAAQICKWLSARNMEPVPSRSGTDRSAVKADEDGVIQGEDTLCEEGQEENVPF